MLEVSQLTFNPFQENTFIVSEPNGNCVIIDPGCYTQEEKIHLKNFISNNNLNPIRLILTHSHLDHIFGSKFVSDTYKLDLEVHPEDKQTLDQFEKTTTLYGIPNCEVPPTPLTSLSENNTIQIGEEVLQILFVPGHAPGHVAFYNKNANFVINGDCLFRGSIGRTDLPGGNHEQLLNSIKTKLFKLPDDCKVYSGHGPTTTIGFEKANNPFFN